MSNGNVHEICDSQKWDSYMASIRAPMAAPGPPRSSQYIVFVNGAWRMGLGSTRPIRVIGSI